MTSRCTNYDWEPLKYHNQTNAVTMTGERVNATNRPLSCHHCRKRKVACDKLLPCQPCRHSGLTCVFPSGRKQTSRTDNSELLRRISRLEQLIIRSGADAPESPAPPSPTSQDLSSSTSDPSRHWSDSGKQDVGSNDKISGEKDASDRFVGHSFLKSLATEASFRRASAYCYALISSRTCR